MTKKVLTFDVDPSSLIALCEALPAWDIQSRDAASKTSLTRDEAIEAADLLVLGAHEDVRRTLALCRALRRESGRGGPSLLVLVPASLPGLVREVREAGADDCLMLPIEAKGLEAILQAHRGSPPPCVPGGVSDNPACRSSEANDRWQDEGGQG